MMVRSELPPDGARIAELAEIFRMMGDASRLKIVLACLDTPRSVGDIAADAGLSQSSASHHLRLLRAARILRGDRRGKHVYYTPMDDHIRRVVTDMVDHISEPEHP